MFVRSRAVTTTTTWWRSPATTWSASGGGLTRRLASRTHNHQEWSCFHYYLYLHLWVFHSHVSLPCLHFEKFIESNHLFHPASVAVVSCDHQTYFCSLLKQILIEKLNQDTKNKSNPVNKKRKLKPVAQESVKYS